MMQLDSMSFQYSLKFYFISIIWRNVIDIQKNNNRKDLFLVFCQTSLHVITGNESVLKTFAGFSGVRPSLYRMTPKITINVPTPLKNVTGLWKIKTDNQINNARLTVLATLSTNNTRDKDKQRKIDVTYVLLARYKPSQQKQQPIVCDRKIRWKYREEEVDWMWVVMLMAHRRNREVKEFEKYKREDSPRIVIPRQCNGNVHCWLTFLNRHFVN